ncbi:cardiolipin synthase [Enterococcus alcedinis]|uniref:Cardiolipin synthase n=1 Tax=Enterococcus alcedinis TaxID=1274384 RepID=A0A917JCU8_9ENTE|nr:cardiolipin synthase [Enterococcus alcedinis]MBP2100864.1 cardiolipin synthase [Enterococcus alcedinis]GGI64838.1 cardiolipin synthase [Enterococcus alcedinis]
MDWFKQLDVSIAIQVLIFFLFVNTIGALITVFRRPRSIASVFAWMMALIFLPGLGFFLYAFVGRKIDGEVIYLLNSHHQRRISEINQMIEEHNQKFSDGEIASSSRLLKDYFDYAEESPLTRGNQLEIITDGKQKFSELFADINQAKETIHIEYYAIFDDRIGNQLLNLLIQKAKEGVKVRVLFDPFGGRTTVKFFKPLIAVGGKVLPFITARDFIRKTRLNYHLHRKIVVIDGKISWTGGFNVGDQYLNETKRFGYWRDTHARMIGTVSFSLQEVFIRDWNASVIKPEDYLEYDEKYFCLPEESEYGDVQLQVVADGPDADDQILKGGFIKMILSAKKRIWIQSPYLIPDDSMLDALNIAVRSGVDVRIMIPNRPDHPFIYRATQYYANFLHKKGVKIYIYKGGFLHAKTLVVDHELASFGTTNQDIRSYALNFEVNTFAYSQAVTDELASIFKADMLESTVLTTEMIAKQSKWLRTKQAFSRLLSPIL